MTSPWVMEKRIGSMLAWEKSEIFLPAHFNGALCHRYRVAKVQAMENQGVEA